MQIRAFTERALKAAAMAAPLAMPTPPPPLPSLASKGEGGGGRHARRPFARPPPDGCGAVFPSLSLCSLRKRSDLDPPSKVHMLRISLCSLFCPQRILPHRQSLLFPFLPYHWEKKLSFLPLDHSLWRK